MRRRDFAAGLLAGGALPWGARAWAATGAQRDTEETLRALEHASGGRLGVFMLDTATGATVAHRADERFPMCSTFKALLAGHVLHRVDRGEESLSRRVAYGPADLLEYAPITRAHVGEGGLAVAALCEAAITVSDNTAANLLLHASGGPAGLTAFLRSIGDDTTRLDRIEPELNVWAPGELRDTSTPRAMARSLRALVLDDVLSAASRERLQAWLRATTTGDKRLRAGLPHEWTVGDKTGTWSDATVNDCAVVWTPRGGPWVVTAFLCGLPSKRPMEEGTLAEVGRVLARQVGTGHAASPG
jgi:beta-lactamase class A